MALLVLSRPVPSGGAVGRNRLDGALPRSNLALRSEGRWRRRSRLGGGPAEVEEPVGRRRAGAGVGLGALPQLDDLLGDIIEESESRVAVGQPRGERNAD